MTGKRFVETRLARTVKIREENSITALEVMSRFAPVPDWLIYFPPAMSPCETSKRADYLEYPTEAFEYLRRVICEEKHLGWRAVVVVCRDGDTARRRFGVFAGLDGIAAGGGFAHFGFGAGGLLGVGAVNGATGVRCLF